MVDDENEHVDSQQSVSAEQQEIFVEIRIKIEIGTSEQAEEESPSIAKTTDAPINSRSLILGCDRPPDRV